MSLAPWVSAWSVPMHDVRAGVAVFLLLNVLAGLVRVARGPSLADRILDVMRLKNRA